MQAYLHAKKQLLFKKFLFYIDTPVSDILYVECVSNVDNVKLYSIDEWSNYVYSYLIQNDTLMS